MQYVGVAAATKAGQYMHVRVGKFNQLIFAGIKEAYGLAGNSPDQLEALLLAKLRTVFPELPDGALELVRVGTLQVDKKKRFDFRKARTLGGKGPRAWLVDEGMRVFVHTDLGKALIALLETAETAEGLPFLLFPNQPAGTLSTE